MKFKEGDRVRLPEWDNDTEIIPEQTGTVLYAEQCSWGESYTVEIDEPEDENDDCIREVTSDQMEAL